MGRWETPWRHPLPVKLSEVRGFWSAKHTEPDSCRCKLPCHTCTTLPCYPCGGRRVLNYMASVTNVLGAAKMLSPS